LKKIKIPAIAKFILEKAISLVAAATEWALLAMALIVFYDVLLRYVFNRPTAWALEISEYILVFLAFAGASEVQRNRSHIKMDFFYLKFPLSVRRYLDTFFSLLMALFSYLLMWHSIKMTIIAYRYGSASNSLLETPLFIPYSIVPITMCLLMLQSIVDITGSIKKKENPQ